MEAIKNLREAAQRILNNEIEPLQLVPSVAIKLLKLTNDENARIDDLSRIIETEPTLAAKILRNVNSAAYSLPNKIASIHRAVNILGFSTVRRIALAQLFYNKLIRYNPHTKFNQLFFWQHCLFVASLSREIALELKHPDPDMVYTAGLIHDIGKVVLETYGRLTYSSFIGTKTNLYSTIEAERNFFGLTHAEIGYIFCLEWQMPDPITAVVACHHSLTYPEMVFAGFQQEIAIVAFANYIAWMQGVGSFDDNECQPKIGHELLTKINADQLNLDYLLQRVDQDMQNTLEFYGIQFPSVYKLRATLVKTSISRSLTTIDKSSLNELRDEPSYLSSLTAPHQSLDVDIFMPRTLKAIYSDFSFDRVMMLNINPKRRCLVATYYWPESLLLKDFQKLEIDISTISGQFLECLREKNSAVITNASESENPVLKRLNINEFLVVPVKHQERLLGVLYADNFISNKKFNQQLLSELNPIAVELGIAMIHAKQYEMEKKQAQLDPLTQLYNKRMIHFYLSDIFQQEASKLEKIAIGFIDIDRFKLFNDVCGHQSGDDALKIVAEIIGNLTRPEDFIGRYGGEEFIFLLRNTNKAGAFAYAERIRKEIERNGQLLRKKFHGLELTGSIGVATYNQQYSRYSDMIEVADQAMYRAKNEGRNKVIMISE